MEIRQCFQALSRGECMGCSWYKKELWCCSLIVDGAGGHFMWKKITQIILVVLEVFTYLYGWMCIYNEGKGPLIVFAVWNGVLEYVFWLTSSTTPTSSCPTSVLFMKVHLCWYKLLFWFNFWLKHKNSEVGIIFCVWIKS